jgi:glycosyltransferase involved in cell wall biosynthesis
MFLIGGAANPVLHGGGRRMPPAAGHGRAAAVPEVVFVGPLRGPPTGMVAASRAILEGLRERFSCRIHDTRSLARGAMGRGCGRAWRYAAACAGLLAGRAPAEGGGVFLALNSKGALLFDAAAVAAARLAGRRILLHHHCANYVQAQSRSMRLVCALAGPRAVHVVPSEAYGADLASLYRRARRTIVLPLALEPPAAPQPRPGRTGSPAFGFFSNVIPGKGVEDFLLLARAVEERDPAARFLVAGRLVDAALAARVGAFCRSRPSRAECVGPVDANRRSEFFDRIDVFCFMSRQEAWGMVVTEAMRRGVPVAFLRNRHVAAQFDAACRWEFDRGRPDWAERMAEALLRAAADPAALQAWSARLRGNYARLWHAHRRGLAAIGQALAARAPAGGEGRG